MITLNLIQGSPEWHEHRAKHFNASDAPAMLGESKYKTRSQLLRERQTGIIQDVDSATQRIFDNGHKYEALARPIAEGIIGDDLYPLTGINGHLSASFDGITMLEDVIFEHKTLNNDLKQVTSIEELPLMYRIQMEQQLYVSGADKCLFMASSWTDSGELLEEIHFWYESDMDLRQRILSGWDQFEKDLEIYEPDIIQEMPIAEATDSLPTLSIRVNGELAIVSNLSLFGAQLRQFVGGITKDPQNDQDFANLESACKKLKESEDALEKAENYALAQIEDVNAMRQAVSELKELARNTRLASEKLVKSQKEVIKLNIVNNAKEKLRAHVVALQTLLSVTLNIVEPNFGEAMKNKRTISSLHDAVDTVLANAKSEATILANELRDKHIWYIENSNGFNFLFNDLQSLIYKQREDFELVVNTRIKGHQDAERIKAELAEKERIEREERIAKEAADERAKIEKESLSPEQVILAQVVSEHFSINVTDNNTAIPSRIALINAISLKFYVSAVIAEQWLVDEFGAKTKPRKPRQAKVEDVVQVSDEVVDTETGEIIVADDYPWTEPQEAVAQVNDQNQEWLDRIEKCASLADISHILADLKKHPDLRESLIPAIRSKQEAIRSNAEGMAA